MQDTINTADNPTNPSTIPSPGAWRPERLARVHTTGRGWDTGSGWLPEAAPAPLATLRVVLAAGTLLRQACRDIGPTGYSQKDWERPPALSFPAPLSQFS